MNVPEKLRNSIPEPLKARIRPFVYHFIDKHKSELSFWRRRLAIDNGVFKNSHYSRFMLAMVEESDDTFLEGKIVADFGSGPVAGWNGLSPQLYR